MSSTTKAIMDDVVTLINGGTFSQTFTATGVLFEENDLKDIQSLNVYVTPMSRDRQAHTRDKRKRATTMRVIVANRTPTDDAIDSMVSLVEELEDFLDADANGLLTTSAARRATDSVRTDPIYDVGLLREANVFVSEIEVVYWVIA